jgi:hypothetical protein
LGRSEVSIDTLICRRTFLLGVLGGALTGPFLTRNAHAAPVPAAAASLGPLTEIPQTYNNCGPATIAEVLAYWGISRTQADVQAALRVDGPVVGMTPYGVPSYARSLGLRALMGAGGNTRLIKSFVEHRIPVIVHQVVSLSDTTGHWRPVEAYDDRQGVFVTADTYLGAGYRLDYDSFARLWALRDNAFTVLYPASRQAAVSASLSASGWQKAAAYQHDLAMLQAYRLDPTPASAPAAAGSGYRYLAMAWDEVQLGRASAARAYLRQASLAGANPVEVRWVGAELARGAGGA